MSSKIQSNHTTIWRIRKVSCDGGKLGKEWATEFFTDMNMAENRLMEWVAEHNNRNPQYKFKTELEEIDGVRGFCNWQFGIMLAIENVKLTLGSPMQHDLVGQII